MFAVAEVKVLKTWHVMDSILRSLNNRFYDLKRGSKTGEPTNETKCENKKAY